MHGAEKENLDASEGTTCFALQLSGKLDEGNRTMLMMSQGLKCQVAPPCHHADAVRVAGTQQHTPAVSLPLLYTVAAGIKITGAHCISNTNTAQRKVVRWWDFAEPAEMRGGADGVGPTEERNGRWFVRRPS